MRSSIVSFCLAATCAACASTSPAQHPSAGEHEALAHGDDRAAQEHLTAANVTPSRQGTRCGAHGYAETCWTPNDDAHRAAAEQHMQEAMQHRAASDALRSAQTRACADVSQLDREVSPFAHVKDITRVEPLMTGAHLTGATVTFRHIEGMTPQLLQRIVDCHVAEADALGHDVPEEGFCPLNLPNVKATVTPAASGYEVAVATDDPAAAKEVLRRAQALRQ